MSKKQRKAGRREYSRRQQRKIKSGVMLLFVASVAAVGLMGFVNHMPMGNRYTYTNASDLWFVENGEMQIAAPELIVLTPQPKPSPTPEPSATPEPTDTAEPDAEGEIWELPAEEVAE